MSGPLTVMPSNNTGATVRALADRFPGRLAHLISPGGWRVPLLPYALDNGAFGAFVRQEPFDGEAFLGLCDRARRYTQHEPEGASGAPGEAEAVLEQLIAEQKAEEEQDTTFDEDPDGTDDGRVLSQLEDGGGDDEDEED